MKNRSVVAAATVAGLAFALTATPAYAADFSGDQIDFGTQYYESNVIGNSGLQGAYPDDWQLGPDGNMFDEGMTVYGYT
ncbi:MAG: hypothetical protein LH471_07265, partial [Salinibacterium sp.]|nr:hypothetical protein [Salinibacterium sp.]